MFASVATGGRIEAAEAELTLRVGRVIAKRHPDTLVAEIAGGAAVSTTLGSPFDKVIGLGFVHFDDAALSAFVAFEETVLARGGTVQVELASLADPAVARMLASRGYGLSGFENVLGLGLGAAGVTRTGTDVPGVLVERARREELERWIDVVLTGFMHPDIADGPQSHESFPRANVERAMRDMLQGAELSCYLAWREGVLAGGASLRLDTARRVAQLTGAATLPAERRRGVQSALLHARLVDATAAGAELAVITTRPGSKSQQNAMGSGFALLYTRAVLCKPAL
jgi:hypothetical protein